MRFPDVQISHFENVEFGSFGNINPVQKSVSINPYGIPEPPKPLRNCQSLDWAQKPKKFESLGGQGEFLIILQGCTPLYRHGVSSDLALYFIVFHEISLISRVGRLAVCGSLWHGSPGP